MLVLEPCPSYSPEVCRPAMARLWKAAGGLDWVRPGMTVGVKVNLVAALSDNTLNNGLAQALAVNYNNIALFGGIEKVMNDKLLAVLKSRDN